MNYQKRLDLIRYVGGEEYVVRIPSVFFLLCATGGFFLNRGSDGGLITPVLCAIYPLLDFIFARRPEFVYSVGETRS